MKSNYDESRVWNWKNQPSQICNTACFVVNICHSHIATITGNAEGTKPL